jgi:glycosyl transferase, family 25
MKVFVVHYSKLTERKTHMINQFKEKYIEDYEFVERFNKEDLKHEDYMKFGMNIKPSMVSVSLKTFWIYNEIASKYDSGLIFEDDVILCEGFVEKLNTYMKELPKDWDMVFIGDGLKFHIPQSEIVPSKHIYKKGHEPTSWGGLGCTRCVDSYIVSNKCAKKLTEYLSNRRFYKISLDIDHFLNFVAKTLVLNVYWAEPTIVTQGSESGLFTSSHDKKFYSFL